MKKSDGAGHAKPKKAKKEASLFLSIHRYLGAVKECLLAPHLELGDDLTGFNAVLRR